MMPQQFMLNQSSYEHFLGLGHFIADILKHVSSLTPFLINIREPKYKQNNSGHQISRQ